MGDDFRNEVGFSASKKKTLDKCARKTWYSSYAFWKGWWNRKKPPKSKHAEQAYNYKHVNNRFSWMGKIVHSQAAWALKTSMEGRTWNREILRNTLLERAAKEVTKGLKQAKTQESGNPKYRLQLIEVMKGEELDEEWIRETIREKIISLTSVDDSWIGLSKNVNLFLRAMQRRDRIVVVEDLVSFEMEGVKVWLSIDLMMRSARNPLTECVITDWKTGKAREENSDQLHVYKAWAKSLNWDDAIMLLVHLEQGSTRVIQISSDEDSVAITRKNINEYLDSLRPRLVDGDIHRNLPIESKFEPTADAANCRDCEFQLLCERDGTKPRDYGPLDGEPAS